MASSKKAVYAAIVGNFAIAVTKFIAAGITGSSAMMSEGIHSMVDTGNGGLLLVGMRRSRRKPTRQHPFGYGKDLYFYTLIVAILIFGVGGGISIYEGILHVLHPVEMGDPTISYVVLSLAVVFEASVWWVAFKAFRNLSTGKGFWAEIRSSKDPTTFTVLFEDTAALLGLLFALVGIYLANLLEMPVLDGVASICIGVLLCVVASLLVIESKGLLLGESVGPDVRESVQRVTRADPAVEDVVRMMSMHMGPHEVVLNLDIAFRGGLGVSDVEAAVDRIDRALREEHPDIRYVTIEAESLPEEDSAPPSPPVRR